MKITRAGTKRFPRTAESSSSFLRARQMREHEVVVAEFNEGGGVAGVCEEREFKCVRKGDQRISHGPREYVPPPTRVRARALRH